MLVCAPISAVISMRYGKKIRAYADERRSIYGGYLGWLVEMLRGLKDIRLLTAEKSVMLGLTKRHRGIFAVNIKTALAAVTADRIIQFANLIVQLAIFAAAAFLTARGQITIGIFTVMITFFMQLKDGIIRLSQNNMDAQERMDAAREGPQGFQQYQPVFDFIKHPRRPPSRRTVCETARSCAPSHWDRRFRRSASFPSARPGRIA